MAGDYPQDSMYLFAAPFNNWYRDLPLDKMAAAAVVTGAAILHPDSVSSESLGDGEDTL